MIMLIQENKVLVAGVYNWNGTMKKEDRMKNPEYDRYIFADIDQLQPYRLDAVLDIYKKNKVSVVVQRVGRGWHLFGDIVNFETLKKMRQEMKDYVDPRAGTCLRITRKTPNEVWLKPEWHNFSSYPERPNWVKAISYFLCREERFENEEWLKRAVNKCGIYKYWQPAYYLVGVKRT
jgi:hypothetical protein